MWFVCCDSGFVQKLVFLSICAFVDQLWQSDASFLGARAAELLFNTDQNPQCGGNRPQTLNSLCLPCASSHCCWLHGLQPQLWICYCSWGYEGIVAVFVFVDDVFLEEFSQSYLCWNSSERRLFVVLRQFAGEEERAISNLVKPLETFYSHSLLWISEIHQCYFRREPFI